MGISSDSYYCPAWYAVMIAADACNAKPWEMFDHPYWRDKALVKHAAEKQARQLLKDAGYV